LRLFLKLNNNIRNKKTNLDLKLFRSITKELSMTMKQSDAVVAAMISICGQVEGAYTPTTEQRAQVRLILFEGFKAKTIDLDPDKYARGEDYIWGYIPGLISNHLRKDKRLNGGVKHEIVNPGSRSGSSDPELKSLMALYGTLETESDKTEVMGYITARKAALSKAKAPVIDVASLPEALRIKFIK
jgi:hypothetical protein